MNKRILRTLPILVLSLILSACGKQAVAIEDYTWEMRTVMKNDIDAANDAASNAFVPAVGQPDALYPNAKVVEMTLTAKNGVITLTDATNDKVYDGTYNEIEKTPDGITYEITLDGISGYADVSYTEEYAGTEVPTLPINLGEYSIFFIPADSQIDR